MKRALVRILLGGLLVSGCCTKKDCVVPDGAGFALRNAPPAATDSSIVLYRYEPGTLYASGRPIDSVPVQRARQDTVQHLLFIANGYPEGTTNSGSRFLQAPYDYRVLLRGTGRQYVLSHLTKTTHTCNACFLTKDEYEDIGSLRVDGVQYAGGGAVVDY